MKRRFGAVAAVVVLVGALVAWRCHNRAASGPAQPGAGSAAGSAAALKRDPDAHKDPRTLKRASIAGTVTAEDAPKQPIAHARVCVDPSSRELPEDLVRDPICVETDAAGHYKVENLLAASYSVAAMAKQMRPAIFHPDGDRNKSTFKLHAGEAKTGVDLAMRGGGVELTGIVNDISGGTVAHAQVRARGAWRMWGTGSAEGVAVDTDEHGAFSMWVKRGDAIVTARADGYAPGEASGQAPGKVELYLTPESTLAGVVLDAGTQKPLAGVRVNVGRNDYWGGDGGDAYDLSDADGKFRVSRLKPGRYVASVREQHGYGRTDGSTLVGLGQHVDGLVVRVYPARRIEGMVVLAGTKDPCPEGYAYFRNSATNDWVSMEREDDGTLHADAVLPGTYSPQINCRDHQSRDHYDDVVVKDKDVTGLVWEVDAGARVRGKVLAKSGEPIEDASVSARTTGGGAREKTGRSWDSSRRDGAYELTGMKAGTYKLEVSSDHGIGPKDGFDVTVPAGGTVDKDLVLDDAGTIVGTVAGDDGKGVGGVHVIARPTDREGWYWGGSDSRSDESGAFKIEGVRQGDYRVTAVKGWSESLKKPGTTDDAKQGEKIAVKAGETATVHLVVEAQGGVIKGTVVDALGHPVTDAFISTARESDAAGSQHSSVEQTRDWGDWDTDTKPVLTGTDGAFAVTKLAPGNYTLRAYRKGGGEAVAEHVPVGTSGARLQIKPTGSIEGAATRSGGSLPATLSIAVRDLKSGFERTETFYMTNGHFAVHDLPAGHFHVEASGEGAQKSTELDLAEGEAKTGVEIALDVLVTITGRVVELGTTKPVPAMRVFAQPARGGGFSFVMDDANDNVTGDDGRFTLKNVPRGQVSITGMAKDFTDDSDYQWFYALRNITTDGTVDVGDLTVVKKRVKKGDPVGDLGIHWAEQANDTPPEQRKFQVSFLDPAGPAAKTDLKVGDVITSVDGVDVTGPQVMNGYMLMQVPPGTKVTLGTARGASVAIVAAAP